jgi:hypothetical protein
VAFKISWAMWSQSICRRPRSVGWKKCRQPHGPCCSTAWSNIGAMTPCSMPRFPNPRASRPWSVFSRTIVDLLTPGSAEPTLADIDAGVRALDKSPKLQQALSSILKASNGDFGSFIGALQAWFDRQMDRVTGSYKRWAKRWVIIIAIVVVCATNLDCIAIARAFYASGAVRAAVVQQASESFCSTPADPTRCAQQATYFLEKTATPLGWSAPNPQDGIWGWDLGLATEDSWLADLSRRCHARSTFLVSLAGSHRNAA